MLTQDQILKDIFKDREFRKITRSIVKPRFDLVDDIMQDAFIVLWDNRERLNLVDCYQKNPSIIKAIYWRWCYYTYNSNSTQKRYGLNITTVSVTDNIKFCYEYVPGERDEIEFEEYLFKEGLRPDRNDNEEAHYYKGLLREHFGVSYSATGKLINLDYKSTRTIQDLTGINYVTVSKDINAGFNYIYTEYQNK